VGHEVGAIALDLLVGRDGAEDDFGELAAFEGAVCYATITSSVFSMHKGIVYRTRQPQEAS